MGEIIIRAANGYDELFQQGEEGKKEIPLWPGETFDAHRGITIHHCHGEASAKVEVVFNEATSRVIYLYPGRQFSDSTSLSGVQGETRGVLAIGGQYIWHKPDVVPITEG
jgi:hypothetical protein